MRRVGGENEVKAQTEGVIWKAKWVGWGGSSFGKAKSDLGFTSTDKSNFNIDFLVGLSDAYDPLDPNGNITIKWDVMSWTGDGYVATVTLYNFQQYRHIQSPGWRLGWTWAKKEVIWSMVGGQATHQGDCSKYKTNIPHSCMKSPTIVDLLPGTPPNDQVANCCRGGVISAWAQDPENSISSFQIVVGTEGNTNTTVKLPKNHTLLSPGPGYTCGAASIVTPTQFKSADGRRVTQAMSKLLGDRILETISSMFFAIMHHMTWNVTCTYSQFLAGKNPTCCVSLSSFYNDTIVPCPTCTCGCKNNVTHPGSCVNPSSPYLESVVAGSTSNNPYSPLVQCTNHMCPIRVHWHVKLNYKSYWRIKVTVINFNYKMNYSQWNLVAQHPNFDNVTQVFSFSYKSLTPYGDATNDTALLWGEKFYNDILMEAGPLGNVQSEILFQKDASTFTFEKGWAFPQRIYFNGDNCVMPPPDAYPFLPNSSSRPDISFLTLILTLLLSLVFCYAHV
ncbi:hypothetical protein RHSIM_Rhsim08G0076100 [Rhododendron simsii]|uniref:COBRA C-terminal domain-containing protein n=1 Tax=Rhododendron simsii TaxID=118357 RepID=A0A834GIQ6_RHOSS|nr:hypothetical protein RHSIM_Rhsim08G0076100 [Rhododendron simsii]